MKYSSLIDNVTSKEWGLNIQQAYLFDWIYSLPSWATSAMIDGYEYFYASRHKAVEELPLLTDKVDTMYRYFKSLEDLGLVILKKIDGKDYVALTEKAKIWGRQSEYSEKNPSKSGKFSEPLFNINNITNNNTSSSKDEGNSSTLFDIPDTDNHKPKKKRGAAKQVDECYQEFVDIWTKEYPILGFDAISGAKLKSIIKKTRAHVKGKGKVDDKETVCNMFRYIIMYVKREHHFCDGKPLTTWDNQYLSIIHEISNGRTTPTKKSTRDIINDL